MKKVIYIQGIHNLSFTNEGTFKVLKSIGIEVFHFPMFYSLHQKEKHLDLIEKINSFLEIHEGPFTLLGHSFGGIIAYSLKDDVYKKIDRIITMGSPHQVKFKWFLKIISNLPYSVDVMVKDQRSYGFLFDVTVPYIFTKYKNSQVHRNLAGTHGFALKSNYFVKNLFK